LWGSVISAAFAAAGWIQTSDTGQVVWTATVLSGCVITAVTGGLVTMTYTSYTGPVPRAGMSFTFSSFSHGANNAAFNILSVNTGTNTITLANSSGLTDTGGSGTTTANTAVPSINTYPLYEIWGMNDALQATAPFYVQVSYGSGSVTSTPYVVVQMGTGTSGAGRLSGNVGSAFQLSKNDSGSGGATLYECDFAGGTNWMTFILWRNSTGILSRLFAIDRARDVFGNPRGDYVTVLADGNKIVVEQTIYRVGLGTFSTESGTDTAESGRWLALMTLTETSTAGVGKNSIMASPVFPLAGCVDYPHLCAVVCLPADAYEGQIINAQFYGQAHSYLFTKSTGIYAASGQGNTGRGYPAIRWE
jgi:hypothetical protein